MTAQLLTYLALGVLLHSMIPQVALANVASEIFASNVCITPFPQARDVLRSVHPLDAMTVPEMLRDAAGRNPKATNLRGSLVNPFTSRHGRG